MIDIYIWNPLPWINLNESKEQRKYLANWLRNVTFSIFHYISLIYVCCPQYWQCLGVNKVVIAVCQMAPSGTLLCTALHTIPTTTPHLSDHYHSIAFHSFMSTQSCSFFWEVFMRYLKLNLRKKFDKKKTTAETRRRLFILVCDITKY